MEYDNLKEHIIIHDRFRFEVKINLPAISSYTVEYYFFIPSSLNISYYTYDKLSFYSSLQRYIRYDIPDMNLYNIIDEKNILSPYNKALFYLDELKNKKEDIFLIESFIDEIKLLGSVVKYNINNHYQNIIENKIENNNSINELLLIFKMIDEMMKNIYVKLSSYKYSKEILDAFKYVDEYLNILKMENLVNILKEKGDSINKDLKVKVEDFIIKLSQNMRFKNYSFNDFEFFVYYKSLLKKFVSSCLFLKAEPTFNIYYHTISGIASAVAMLFAILVTIYAQQKYSFTSIFFILIAVISYVFKDRIKEFVKIIFIKGNYNWVFDRKVKITEPAHGIKIGNIKEVFSIANIDSVGKDIIEVRNKDNLELIDTDAKIEVVLKYKKVINLDYDMINKYHTRRKKLVTILRFSIQDFLKHSDDPEIKYNIYKDGKIQTVDLRRVYHMNIVVKFYSKVKDAMYERYRVIFSRERIIRVEKL